MRNRLILLILLSLQIVGCASYHRRQPFIVQENNEGRENMFEWAKRRERENPKMFKAVNAYYDAQKKLPTMIVIIDSK